MILISSLDGGFAWSHLSCVVSYKATRSTNQAHRGTMICLLRLNCNGAHGNGQLWSSWIWLRINCF